MSRATKPLVVDFTHNEWDQKVRVYGAMARTTKFIMEKTGLTKHQVNYRIRAAMVSRLAARNGETPISRMIEKEMYGLIDSYFMKGG